MHNRHQIPILGAHPNPSQTAEQLFLSMYLPLIPSLAVHRAIHGYEQDGCMERGTPERVASEAWDYVDAAMRKLGFSQR